MTDAQHQIADVLAVRDVIAALALQSDTGDLSAYGELLADDAVIESPGRTSEGRDAVLASAAEQRTAGMVGPGSGARHHVNPGRVVLDEDRATARSTFAFYTKTEGGPQLTIIGEYDDELRREGGAWRLARRRVSFD